MKSSSIITFFIIMCLLVSGRADALTLEARAAIEEMRSKLTVNPSPVEQRIELTDYIPGKDLEAALTRLRQQFYGIDTTHLAVAIVADPGAGNSRKVEQVTVVEKVLVEEQASVDYIPGSLLSSALAKIRYQQGRDGKPLLDSAINSAVEMSPAQDVSPVLDPVAAPATDVATSTDIIPEPARNSDDLLEAAEKAVEVAEPVKPIKPSIEKKQEKAETVKKSAGKKKRQELIEKAKPVEPAVKEDKVGADLPDKPEDQEFNEFIRRYDFKMPENYRIIVR